ncbi:MAG: hypothetical protein AUI55_07960, partial [Gemmatimonadetes bacterium 13_1_40CM_2_70_7]
MPQAELPLALLVGDREQSTQWLKSLLESGGYAVLEERGGRRALERARSTEPDVILADADLTDLAGVELCRRLRSDPGISSSTPILLSIFERAPRAARLAALRAGAWECIAPPHDADEILLKVGAYVRAKRDADGARADGLLDPVTGLYNRRGLARRALEFWSQARRERRPLACVVWALDVEPAEAAAADERAPSAVLRCVRTLQSAARLSDVIGRLGPTEFAALAPGTDALGARRLAARLAASLEGSTPRVGVRCGYEAVANVGDALLEPLDLLVRASGALRTGRAEAGWSLRRFENEDGIDAAFF